eukprot:2148368-Rhodomonas_salina.1
MSFLLFPSTGSQIALTAVVTASPVIPPRSFLTFDKCSLLSPSSCTALCAQSRQGVSALLLALRFSKPFPQLIGCVTST